MSEPAARLNRQPYRAIIFVLFALTAVWFIFWVIWPSAVRQTHGFVGYYSGSRLVLSGDFSEEVYEPDYFRAVVRSNSDGLVEDVWLNPPSTTVMLLPLAGMPTASARIIWTALNVIFLSAGLSLLVWAYARPAPLVVWLLVFTVAMLFRPVIANFTFGQTHLLLFLLLAVAVVSLERRWDLAGGASLGAALAFKLAGWPLAVLLLWQRRWRYLAVFSASAVLIVLVSLPLTGLASWRAFTTFLPRLLDEPGVCVPAYQTTRSWLCHLFMPQVFWPEVDSLTLPWFARPVLVVVGTGTLFLTLQLSGRRTAAAAAGLVVWGVLFAPLGEGYHHTVVLVPVVWLIALMWRGPAHSRVALLALVLALIFYAVPFPVNHPRLQQGWPALLAYPRLFGAWLVWLAVILSARTLNRLSQSTP